MNATHLVSAAAAANKSLNTNNYPTLFLIASNSGNGGFARGSFRSAHKSMGVMNIKQRAELTEFLRSHDTKISSERELYAKVNKLSKYQRADLIRALTHLYGDVPRSMKTGRISLSIV
jgi:hypothetical protein